MVHTPDFFSESFMRECENQISILQNTISGRVVFGHPLEASQEEVKQAKVFYNKVLFLLHKGGKRTMKQYMYEMYVIDTTDL